jgi:hypothetical protein
MKKVSTVPKSKNPKSKPSLLQKVSSMSRRNLMVLGAFILLFVGTGTFFVTRTEAYAIVGHDCVFRTYSYNPYQYKWCVAQLQSALTNEHNRKPSLVRSPNGTDGYFGVNTRNSVEDFQRNIVHETPDGVVSGQFYTAGATWQKLCSELYGYYVWSQMGCNNL